MELADSAKMKENWKDNPQMLLWLAATEWALRINPDDMPEFPQAGPMGDAFTEGHWAVMEPDEQYWKDVEAPMAELDKYRHVPPSQRGKEKPDG